MKETILAQIRIGGDLPKSLLPELRDILSQEYLITDNSTIDEYIVKDILTLESKDSTFHDLENWLQENNLSFIIESNNLDDKYLPSPYQTIFWTPELEDIRYIINDMEQQHLVHVGEIEWILSAMSSVGSIENAPKFITHGNIHEKAFAAYVLEQNNFDPISYLRNHLKAYYEAPTLPAFKITE